MNDLLATAKDPAKRIEFIMGQPMRPCPKCESYNLRQQTPVRMEDVLLTDSAKQIFGKWLKASAHRPAMMLGPVFIMCAACGHQGPSVDCSGRTREDVGRDLKVSTEMKRLWNEQSR